MVLVHTHKGHNQFVEIQHWTLRSSGRLASKFARFISDWKRLEHMAAAVYASPQPQTLKAVERRLRKSWNQFLWRLCKISSLWCLTDWRQWSETKEMLFRANVEFMHCLEVMLSSYHCAIFGCCNIIEYCNCCWAPVCIIFSSNTLLIIPIVPNDIKFACLWSLQHTSFCFHSLDDYVSPYSLMVHVND